MKKVLIIWLWFRWIKFLKYFLDNSYDVVGICKTIKTKINIEKNYNIKVYNKLDFINDTIMDFSIIIIALPTEIQWEFVLKNIKKFKKADKIIVELPISYDQEIIDKLKKFYNIYFFIEEYITNFSKFLRKIDLSIISDLQIFIYMNSRDDSLCKNKIIHLKSNFLWTNLELEKIPIKIIYSRQYNHKSLYYTINFKYKWTLIFYNFSDNGIKFLIWDKIIKSLWSFEQNLHLFLTLDNNSYNNSYNINSIL